MAFGEEDIARLEAGGGSYLRCNSGRWCIPQLGD
jgi:hypothetical protein